VFFVFAVLAVLQRLSSSSHYPSDVAVGAGLALVAAGLWLSTPAGPATLPMADDTGPC
jgi:membrane-associated phospholipid phosphatase